MIVWSLLSSKERIQAKTVCIHNNRRHRPRQHARWVPPVVWPIGWELQRAGNSPLLSKRVEILE